MGYFVFLFCVGQICVVAPTKSFSCFSACILELYMDIGVLFINMMTYCSEGWREKNMRRIQSILPVWAPKGKEGRSYTTPPPFHIGIISQHDFQEKSLTIKLVNKL
jgi:hypothetical protein